MYRISFSPPDMTEKEIKEVTDAIRSGWISSAPTSTKTNIGDKRVHLMWGRINCDIFFMCFKLIHQIKEMELKKTDISAK